jgi:aminoglycoside phosphotransferase (APT) family kinase protein
MGDGRDGVDGTDDAMSGTGNALRWGMAVTKLHEPVAERRLRDHVMRLFPGARIESIEALGPDSGATAGSTTKAAGYGVPVRIVVSDREGRHELVWRVASANEFGHDRRSDRAAAMVQAFDDFAQIPQHVRAVDLGVIRGGGELMSTRDATEMYLITTYAQGTIYAHDLRRIAADGHATVRDVARVDVLARYLASLHTPMAAGGTRTRYRRAIRDLVGSGEGIFGIIDGYPADVPGASRERLREIEERCVAWRWRLRDREERLTRTHGDFHPFNIVFDGETVELLDASRGGCGDPADDITALAINYLLFAVDARDAWRDGLGVLWRRLWQRYLAERHDPELVAAAPPFLMWRALVVANPVFYPKLSAQGRERLLGFATEVMDRGVLEPEAAEELFG